MTEKPIKETEYIYQVAKFMKDSLEEKTKDMKETATRLESKIDANTQITQQVLIQATKTNGRMTSQEEWSKGAQKIIESNTESINTLKNYRWWFVGFSVAIMTFGYLALKDIVRSTVVDVLNTKADVNYEKSN